MESERKAAFRALARQIGAMPDDKRAALAARLPAIATVEGRTLSPINTMLIAHQCASATIVGGFRQWLAAGRCVRKGEHALNIWVPISRKAKDGEEESETHFMIGNVFDVSQTDEITGRTREDRAAPQPAPAHAESSFESLSSFQRSAS